MSASAVPLLPAPRRELPYATGPRVAYAQAPRSLSNCARVGICGLDAHANDARQQADLACFPSSGCCSSRARRDVSISCIWSPTKMQARRSSASISGGGGAPSGVRNLSSCPDALRDARALADEALALSVRPFGVFLCERGDRCHARHAANRETPA
jgi:hypothetical protein